MNKKNINLYIESSPIKSTAIPNLQNICMPYCIHCGALNPDVAKFCSSCGAAITTSGVSSTHKQQQANQGATNPAAIAHQQTRQQPQQSVTNPAAIAHQQTQPAVTNATSQPQTPVTSQRTPVVKAISHPATGGALLILIGYFLPWAAYYDYYTSSSVNGFTFAKQFIVQSALYNDGGVKAIATLIGISLYIVVAAAGFFLLSSVLNPGINGLARLVRFVPFLVFAAIILLIIIASAATQQKMGSLNGMKIGLYFCFAGSFFMLFLNRRT